MRRYLGAALLIAAAACAKKAVAPTVQTAAVTRRDIIIDAQANGVIEPIAIIEVKSKASGVITQMPVETGTHVKPGDLIVQIDTRDVQNRYDQAKAQLDAAQTKLSVAENDKKRNEEMFKARVITPQEFENVAVELRECEIGRRQREGEPRPREAEPRGRDGEGAGGRHDHRQDRLRRHRHRLGDRLRERRHDDRQDGRPRHGAHPRAVQRDATSATCIPAKPANVTVDAYPDRRFSGVVEKIEPQAVVQQNVTMFPVLVNLDNSEGLLKPGMNGEVRCSSTSATACSPFRTTRSRIRAKRLRRVRCSVSAPTRCRPNCARRASMAAAIAAGSAVERGGGRRGGNGGGGGGCAPTDAVVAAARPTEKSRIVASRARADRAAVRRTAGLRRGLQEDRRRAEGAPEREEAARRSAREDDGAASGGLRWRCGGGGGGPAGDTSGGDSTQRRPRGGTMRAGGGRQHAAAPAVAVGGSPEMQAMNEQIRAIYTALNLDPRTAGACADASRAARAGQTGGATAADRLASRAALAQGGRSRRRPRWAARPQRTRQGLVFVSDSTKTIFHPRVVQLGAGQPRLHRSRERSQGRRASRHARRARAPGAAPAAAGSPPPERQPARRPGTSGPGGPGGPGGGGGGPGVAAVVAAAGVDHMLIGEIISVALGALRANKLRSLLTMLGIVIGVGAVIAVVALGTGAQQAVKDRISRARHDAADGEPRAAARRWRRHRHRRRTAAADDRRREGRRRTRDDICSPCSPRCGRGSRCVYGNKNASTQIIGTTPNYLEVRKYSLKAGRMFAARRRRRPPARRRARCRRSSTNLGITTPEALIGENGAHSRHRSSPSIGVLASKGQASAFQQSGRPGPRPDQHRRASA